MLTKVEKQNTVDGFLMFTIYAFKNPLMILMDANTKWCIVMNNAFFWTKLAYTFEKQRFTDKKNYLFWCL